MRPPVRTSSLAGIRVLVVDDETDARELVATVLRQRGAEVRTASGAAEALAALDEAAADVLVSDIGMPDRNGYHLIRELRRRPAEHGGSTPALARTAYARHKDRQRALAAGYQLYAAKPVDPDELTLLVGRLAGRAC